MTSTRKRSLLKRLFRWLFGARRRDEVRVELPEERVERPGKPAHDVPPPQLAVETRPPPAYATQFPATEDAEPGDLVVGLDFGTSCTKIVIRSPFMYRSRAIAVPTDGLELWPTLPQGLLRYLLPSRLCLEADGTASLEPSSHTVELFDLKLSLMDDPNDVETRARVAVFLALTLRHCREWFLEQQREGYSQYRLRWALNLGIPSAGYDDTSIRNAFEHVARAAWDLSCTPRPASIHAARERVQPGARLPNDPGDSLTVVPEVAAEVVTYARSSLRSTGLHVLMDVGASSLDVCSFVLHEHGGDDQYELLTAQVEKLGALMLHWYRLERLPEEQLLSEVIDRPLRDFTSPVPERIREYVSGPLPSELKPIDEEFMKQCQRILIAALFDLKKRRDPHSPRWDEGLPIFLCGGGSRMHLYRKVVQEAGHQLCSFTNARGLIDRRLPLPDNFLTDGLADTDFDRLAVACGLSYDALDIGTVEPPSEIPDIPPPPIRRYIDNYVSKDMV